MSLIKSISGIRGTIGGAAGNGLTPLDIVKFTSAYATFIRRTTPKTSNVIVVGRSSPTNSLFDPTIATFEDDGGAYNQADAGGFIKLNALRLRIGAKAKNK